MFGIEKEDKMVIWLNSDLIQNKVSAFYIDIKNNVINKMIFID